MDGDAELLRPTIDPRLDSGLLRAMWDPSHVVYAAFFAGVFGGPTAGGLLFGFNYLRMRRAGAALLTAAFGVACEGAVQIAFARALLKAGSSEAVAPNSYRTFGTIAAMLAWIFVARRQSPSFVAATLRGVRPMRLWPAAFAAAALGYGARLAVGAGLESYYA